MIDERPRRSAGIPAFIALAYGLSWLVWSPLALHALGALAERPPAWLHLLGSLGPATAAFVLAARDGSANDLVRRCVRAPLPWVIAALAIPLGLFGVSALAMHLAGAPIAVSAIGRSTEFPALSLATYAIANVVCYGLGEEVGWRGYLLPRLAPGPRAVLAVAAIWAGWHLPLFAFSPGMSAMGLAGAVGWLASLVAGSLLMAELYAASGSLLVLALLHGALDVLINSPVGGVQSVMGALVTVAGFTAPLWVRGLAARIRARDRG